MNRPATGSTNTAESFRDKWSRNPGLAFEETLREGSEILSWILERNGFDSVDALARHLERRRRILDAGCGNGRVTALLREHTVAATTEIVALDRSAADVARVNLSTYPNVTVLERDLLTDLSDLGLFDFIYCQEVLHHTGDPERAFQGLASLLEPGGEIAIYVYRRKAPVREFVDDYVRDRISELSYEEAIQASREFAELGRALSEANVRVNVPAVRLLEIEAGEYDVQRLLYHFFVKCFWSPELGAEASAVINYDWYHPQDCSRHTLDEVLGWFHAAGLDVVHERVDWYGITVRGVKRA